MNFVGGFHFNPLQNKFCSQELKPTDHEQQENFAVRTEVVFEEEEEHPIIIISDEANFHLMVQKKNATVVTGYIIIMYIHQQLLRVVYNCMVCAAPFAIAGPYFLEENRHTIIVNSASNIEMIRNILYPKLCR